MNEITYTIVTIIVLVGIPIGCIALPAWLIRRLILKENNANKKGMALPCTVIDNEYSVNMDDDSNTSDLRFPVWEYYYNGQRRTFVDYKRKMDGYRKVGTKSVIYVDKENGHPIMVKTSTTDKGISIGVIVLVILFEIPVLIFWLVSLLLIIFKDGFYGI